MPSLRDILWLVGLPAILTALVMLATRPWRRDGRNDRADRAATGWAAAIAIAGGFAIAFTGIFFTPNGVLTLPKFPPNVGEHWVFFLTLPIVLVALAHTFVRPKWFGISASVVLLLVTPYLVRRSQQPYIEVRLFWGWVIGAAVVMASWWLLMEPLARRVRGASLPLLLATFAGVSGLTIIDAGIQTLGMVTGSIAVTLLIIALAAGWSRATPLPRGGMLAVALLVPAMLLCGYFFAELKLRDLILLSAAPLAAWAGELPRLGPSDSWRRIIVRWVAVLGVLGLTAVSAIVGLKKTVDDQMNSFVY